MADFFNKLKKSIDKGTAIVSAKSNTLIETNKLKSEISAVNKVKNEALMTLGRKVYNEGKEGTFSIEGVEELITSISEKELKIVDLEAKISLIQEEEKDKMTAINAEEVVVAEEEVVEEGVEVVEDTVEDVQEEVQAAVDEVVAEAPFEKPDQY